MFLLIFCSPIYVCFSVFEAPDVGSDAVCLAFFGTSRCHFCEEKWSLVADLEGYYPNLIVMRFDYMDEEDRSLEDYLFTKFNLPLNSPRTAVFVGNDYLLGVDITEKSLRSLIEKYLDSGAKPVWKYIYLAYFGFSSCFSCDLDWQMINRLREDYPMLVPKRFDCLNKSVVNMENELLRLYRVDVKAPRVAVFVGRHCLISEDIYEERLREIIEIYVGEGVGTIPPWKLLKTATKKLSLPVLSMVILGGLADGINPCAFTVLIFFISYLVYLKRSKTEIVLTGVSFISAVFTAYLIMGFGLMFFIVKLEFFPAINLMIKVITAIFALILCFVNLHDYHILKKGDVNRVFIKIPKSLHGKFHSIVRKMGETKFIVPFTFFAGLLVSIFEFACTGQVYIPIILLLSDPSLQFQALVYLALYNFMFIMPLITLFLAVYIGASIKEINNRISKHADKMKLLTSIILLFLAIILLTQIFSSL